MLLPPGAGLPDAVRIADKSTNIAGIKEIWKAGKEEVSMAAGCLPAANCIPRLIEKYRETVVS